MAEPMPKRVEADCQVATESMSERMDIESSAAVTDRTHVPWSEVVLLASISVLGLVAMDMYLPALPRMAADLHATPQATQATVSTFLLGLALGQLLFGPLSDRVGRRLPILGGITLFCIATAICAFSPDVSLLVGARLLQALGACAGVVVSRAVVRDRYDDREVMHVFSLLSLVSAIPPVVAPLIGGWVLGIADWRWIFGAQALFALVVGVAVFFRLPESRSAATREHARSENTLMSYLALLRQPLLVGYLLVGAFSGASLFSYIASASRVIMEEFHISATQFGWMFGVNAIGIAASAQLNARLSRRIPSDTLLRGAILVALAAGLLLTCCAIIGFGGLWGVLVPLFVVISSLGFTQPNTTAAAMTVDRHRAGAIAALIGSSFFGVGSLSAAAIGLIPGRASAAMSLVVMVTLTMALWVYCVLIAPKVRRPRA